MLHADLAFDDLPAPLGLIEGGFSIGRSRVQLVQHRMLRAVLLEGADRIVAIVLERFADDPEGIEHVVDAPDGLIQEHLDELEEYPLDFAALTIDRRRRAIRYTASPTISIPVYCLATESRARFDWDYARLLGPGHHEVVWDYALAHIAGISTYGPATMLSGLHRATAGATLVVTTAGVKAILPEPVRHDGPRELPPGVDIETLFRETVISILDARPLDPRRTAVELSGGMDSALTALATAHLTGDGAMSIGAQFDGAMGEAQRARRLLLCRAGGFADLSLPADRYAPFAPQSLRRHRHQVWPEDENYPEIFEAAFHMLRAAGIDTLVSGFGGDELYFSYRGEAEEEGGTAEPPPCPFLTARGMATALGARSTYPSAWLQQTCWQSAASQSQRVLRYGLWPVYPYLNVALARFVSRLPASFRRDRHLLRRTLTRWLGDPVFETTYVKESFDPVARRGISENRVYLQQLIEQSPLSHHGEIDTAAILSALAGDVHRMDRATYNALFRVLKLACFLQAEPPLE
ncbi:asparagine synthase [Myxococcus sp. K15C18031901]|uniref:asparagine synthase n=1 Tax=Myxococcus dinghuensis TaxID=2906761 RepID=UPI0020A73FE2|nr:asparagine synthase [Myxococcus dinghuensis]MCP3100452.1 asparagine synthase [Myxococcus dinghuensis]